MSEKQMNTISFIVGIISFVMTILSASNIKNNAISAIAFFCGVFLTVICAIIFLV